ncbi:MAG: cobalamin-binding protein [candidate division Zixibacteria bacterium]|nr:cobalamin-binding protein [candidate division Zixibacteria bacterium]
MGILDDISASLQKGDTSKVAEFTEQAIVSNIEPKAILDDGLLSGMAIIGEKFKKHEIFLPDVLLAAKAMYAGMDLLKPLMIKEGIPTIGKVVIGSVYGDLHDIGKNLVGIMLKGAGFEVIDLGNNVPAQKFIETAEESGAGLIGMSALLTTTMPTMKKTIELAKERGLYGKIKFMIGGAPLSSDYAGEIGADAYCFDGVNAVERAKEFLGVG